MLINASSFYDYIIRPSWKVNYIAITAIVFAFTIEFSQLYHAPWIDQIRSTMIGGLILGFGFKISDLVCYTIGITLGVNISLLISYLLDKYELAYLRSIE
ncbi:MAG: DUF2809 domain-containing protein [Mariprofundales bacterium]